MLLLLNMKIASVVLKQKSKFIDREFDYLAENQIKIGSSVNVPFGKSNKMYVGIVTSVKELNNESNNLKSIHSINDTEFISEDNIKLAYWIKKQYMCSLYEAINLFISQQKTEPNVYDIYIKPQISAEDIDRILAKEKSNAKIRKTILELLKKGEVNISTLQRECNKSLSSVIKKLESDSVIKIQKRHIQKLPQTSYKTEPKTIIFNTEQKQALIELKENINTGLPTLLHGVTGSGKTEIYIELIKECTERKKQAILLVPEISLAPQTISRLKNVFGDRIGVFHSKISKREKENQLNLISNGKIDIIIGARSALFTPLENLGLIIIDEAHDDSYKSEQSPKYDAIEVAEKICKMKKVGLVLGTATPTVSQYYFAMNNIYDLKVLKQKTNGKLIDIEIIDTLEDLLIDKDKIFNDKVVAAINSEIEQDNQVIIFLNKRGYSTSVTCNYCNHTIKCKNCDISLTYHSDGNKLLCHYCGYEEKPQKKCVKCNSEYIYHGYGTQKIEEELIKKVKNAKISRLDKDTTRNKDSHEKILADFKNKKTNILIGTQMISKGLDFDTVNLVVVLNAEQSLLFPDYRSYEKTFNLLVQVAGRAGRGNKTGKVLIQTNDANNKIFEFVKNQDYKNFYIEQIREREKFLYPPFSFLLKIKCTSENLIDAGETTKRIKDAVNFYSDKKNVEFKALGPVQSFIKKIDNKFS